MTTHDMVAHKWAHCGGVRTMKAELLAHYRRLRAPRFSPYGACQMFVMGASAAYHGARHAVNAERVKAEFDALGDTVRIIARPDECSTIEDLEGDSYNPRVNPETPARILARERAEFVDRVNRDGVWGHIAQSRCPCCGQWRDHDSIWGFVGDDFDGSGYDTNLMQSAIEGSKGNVH